MFTIFSKAKYAKEKIITEDVKAKVATGIDKVGNSGIVQQVKTEVSSSRVMGKL